MADESLEKFRLEYEKLHRALKKSHEQEKRLVKKCRELNSEILNNQAKIKTALRLSQEDQKTITHLQKEMEISVYVTGKGNQSEGDDWAVEGGDGQPQQARGEGRGLEHEPGNSCERVKASQRRATETSG